MKARKSDLVAMGFLIAAVVGFACFLLLDLLEDGSMRGWKLFPLIVESAKSDYLDSGDYLLVAGLGLSSLLVLVSPFLIGIVSRARILWWSIVVFSGMAAIGVTGYLCYLLYDEPGSVVVQYRTGFWCLMIYPVLNLVGLLWIQGRKPEADPNVDLPEGSGAD